MVTEEDLPAITWSTSGFPVASSFGWVGPPCAAWEVPSPAGRVSDRGQRASAGPLQGPALLVAVPQVSAGAVGPAGAPSGWEGRVRPEE